MSFLEDMILCVCVCEAREAREAEKARRGCPEGIGERGRGRKRDVMKKLLG